MRTAAGTGTFQPRRGETKFPARCVSEYSAGHPYVLAAKAYFPEPRVFLALKHGLNSTSVRNPQSIDSLYIAIIFSVVKKRTAPIDRWT